jgi:hypothetical protein
MLAAARRQHRQQSGLAAEAVREARRTARRGPRRAAQAIAAYQLFAVDSAVESTPDVLAEQGIDLTASGAVVAESLVTDPVAVAGMVEEAETPSAFDRLVSTLVVDAFRTAVAVDSARYPGATAYVRQTPDKCCSRCAVLLGRVYRYSTGFQRHPGCNCTMTQTTTAKGRGLVESPDEVFRQGRITNLTRAEVRALNQGANLNQLVNVRRKSAGLVEGSSVLVRAGRPTPAGIYRMASDDAEALALMRRYGYVT